MINGLTFENFQSLKNEQSARFGQLTLLFGPNGSGKSAFARALKNISHAYGSDNRDNRLASAFRSEESTIYGQLKSVKSPNQYSFGFSITLPQDFVLVGVDAVTCKLTNQLGSVRDEDIFELSYTLHMSEKIHSRAEELVQLEIDTRDVEIVLTVPRDQGWDGNSGEIGISDFSDEKNALMEALYLENGTWGSLPDGIPSGQKVTQWDDRHNFWDSDWDLLVGELGELATFHGIQFIFGFSDLDDWDPNNWVQKGEGAAVSSINRFGLLAGLFEEVYIQARRVFTSFEHIPGIRPIPEKLSKVPTFAQRQGVLVNQNIANALEKLTEGRYTDRSRKIRIPELQDYYYSNILHDNFTDADVTFDEVGSGIAQVYPAIAALFDDSSLVYIEQPELHLHPKMQSMFMDIVLEAMAEHPKKQIVIETHSESMLLRVQKNIRKKLVDKEQVSVLFLEPISLTLAGNEIELGAERWTTIKEIQIDEIGDLVDPLPVSFVDLRIQDLL